MTTKEEIQAAGGTCVHTATNFWECTDKDGKKWWCDSGSCQPAPQHLVTETIRVHLDLRVMKDMKTGEVVVVAPVTSLAEGERER